MYKMRRFSSFFCYPSHMVDKYALMIWDYMKLNQPLKHCDAVFVLGSNDDRVCEYGARLFMDGYGDWFIVSGGVAHTDDLLATKWKGTEAEYFAGVARKIGVPSDKIILEDKATNTGQCIRFTYELLQKKGITLDSVLLVQKPYGERRTYATFEKQWPDKKTRFIVTSPPISYAEYFNDLQPKDTVINIMVGDFQRMREYPKLGYQTQQHIPDEVWGAYEELVKLGYNKHLVK